MTDLLPCTNCGRTRVSDARFVNECDYPRGPECEGYAAGFEAGRRAPVPSGWRAMRDAPRDGTRVLITHEAPQTLRMPGWVDTDRAPFGPHVLAWMPLPPPFTGNPAELEVGDA